MNRRKSIIGIAAGLALITNLATGEVGPDGPMLPIAKRDAPAASSVARGASEGAQPIGEARYRREAPQPAPPAPAAIAKPKPAETTVWVPGRFEATTTTVLEPGEQREVWIAPVFRNGYDPVACRPTREMVRAGRWEYVREPLRVARRETLQWSPGYEQSVGAPVSRGTLAAPTPEPARPIAKAEARPAAAVEAPQEKSRDKAPGFDLSAGWTVPARDSRSRR